MKNIIITLLAILVAWTPMKAYEKYVNPTGDDFPILAWYSIRPDTALTTERYKEMAEAGFNISFTHSGGPEEMAKALQASQGTGVRIMLGSDAMLAPENVAPIVNRFKNDENLVGWFLRDEPTTHGFAELKQFKDRIRACDDKHMLYLNLLPIYVNPKALGTDTYEEYLQRFVDEIDLGFFSYDNYPVIMHKGDTVLRENFYQNLEDALKVNKKTGEPFWAFVLSTAHDPYPVATSEAMRLEAFSDLAYGAQCIQYFTYWNPGNKGTWNFHMAPISLTGERTHVYYLVKELNKEIQQLKNVFLGAKVIEVAHTGENIPIGAHHLDKLPAPFSSITTDGPGLLISHLQNKGTEYLMLVNRDLHKTQNVTLSKTAKVKRVIAGEPLKKEKGKNVTHILKPGDYLIYQL